MGTVHTKGQTQRQLCGQPLLLSLHLPLCCASVFPPPLSHSLAGGGEGGGEKGGGREGLFMLTKVLTEKSQEGSSSQSSLLVEACILMGH